MGTTIGVIKGDTRSLDSSSCGIQNHTASSSVKVFNAFAAASHDTSCIGRWRKTSLPFQTMIIISILFSIMPIQPQYIPLFPLESQYGSFPNKGTPMS